MSATSNEQHDLQQNGWGMRDPIEQDFSQAVGYIADRLRELEGNAAPEPTSFAQQALEQLVCSVEELYVMQEELQVRSKQLTTAYSQMERDHRRYQQLFMMAPDGNLVLTARTVVEEANHAVADLLGIVAAHVVDKPFRVFVAERHRSIFDRFLATVCSETLPQELEIDLAGAGGSARGRAIPCAIRAVAMRDSRGHVSGYRLVVRDLNERMRARRVAQIEAESRRKDEFLAMLAHELRNPLAPILSAAQLLENNEEPPPAQVHNASSVIVRNVEHLRGLVNDLLDTARLSQGKIRLDPRPVAMREVVEHAAEMIRPLLDSKKQELQLVVDDAALNVLGDPERLRQVVSNLLDNAAKYTPEGGSVTLELRRMGGQVAVCVTDTGIGLRADQLEGIFELFTQGDRTLARSEGGLGLGLALVRRLVELHGGSVAATSEGPGRGSQFVVRLPASGRATSADATRVPAVSAPPRTILVVDDNADVADTLAMLLQAFGHSVQIARSGREAIAAATDSLFDVVLLDLGLPDIDGYEVARELRQLWGESAPALVALTGYGDAESRQLSREAGMAAHLLKPIAADEVKRVLAAL